MKEFLIRWKDKDFCLIHVSKFSDVLHPNSIKSYKIEGWGDYRIKGGDCEIGNEKAETIVNEICQNVEKELEKPCYWIQL